MADVTYIPDQNGQMSNVLPWMLAAGNGGLGGGIFSGNGISAFLGGALGAIFPNFFGNWGGGFNNAGAGGAGFISNQLSNDSGRELLMNSITSQGEASRAAVSTLAASLGQDFTLVNNDIQSLRYALNSLATQQAVSVPEIINRIQSGDASLASQLCQCCCDMRQLTVEQGYQD